MREKWREWRCMLTRGSVGEEEVSMGGETDHYFVIVLSDLSYTGQAPLHLHCKAPN